MDGVYGDFPIKEKSSGCVLIWKFKIRACDVLNGKMYFVFIHSLGKYAYVWNVHITYDMRHAYFYANYNSFAKVSLYYVVIYE